MTGASMKQVKVWSNDQKQVHSEQVTLYQRGN